MFARGPRRDQLKGGTATGKLKLVAVSQFANLEHQDPQLWASSSKCRLRCLGLSAVRSQAKGDSCVVASPRTGVTVKASRNVLMNRPYNLDLALSQVPISKPGGDGDLPAGADPPERLSPSWRCAGRIAPESRPNKNLGRSAVHQSSQLLVSATIRTELVHLLAHDEYLSPRRNQSIRAASLVGKMKKQRPRNHALLVALLNTPEI